MLINKPPEKPLNKEAEGLRKVWLSKQDDFRNFCMRDKTEKICHKLQETIAIYL